MKRTSRLELLERYYPIFAFKKDKDCWEAICPVAEFKKYSVYSNSSFDACVLLVDVILTVCNRHISKDKKLPTGLLEPSYLHIRDKESEGLCWMPLICDMAGAPSYPTAVYSVKDLNTWFTVLPPENIWTKKGICDFAKILQKEVGESINTYGNRLPFNDIRRNGFYLPVFIPLNYQLLEEAMNDILKQSNLESLYNTPIHDFEQMLNIFQTCSESALRSIRSIIAQYSADSIYKLLLPQVETVIYLNNHQVEEIETRPYTTLGKEIDEYYNTTQRINRDKIALAQKQLLDIVAAEPPTGNKQFTTAEYYKLISYSYHLYNSLILSSRIHQHYEISDLCLTKYGIKAYHDKVDEELSLIMKEREAKEIAFGDYKKYISENEKLQELHKKPKEEAFKDEFRLSFSEIETFIEGIVCYCESGKNAYYKIYESDFVKFMGDKYNWTEEMCSYGFNMFCLDNRDGWDNIPKEKRWDFIDPENPFAEYSFRRRPLIRQTFPNGEKTVIYVCERSLSNSWEYLKQRIYDDNYITSSKKMINWIKEIRDEVGNIFPKSVASFISTELKLPTFTSQKPSKLFHLDKDYGDVDIAVLDREKNIFYSIECKNISHARNVRQKNNEYDKFGVVLREGRNEYVVKHTKRDKCLKEHRRELQEIYNFNEEPTIVSLFLVSHVIDSVTTTKDLPIPILTYHELLTEREDALTKIYKQYVS